MAKTKGMKSTKTSRIRRYLFSRPVRLLLPLIIALALLFYFQAPVMGAFNTAGEALIGTFGLGLILVVVTILLLGWMAWRRRIPRFLRIWNRLLGAIAFSVAIFGVLAFFALGGSLGMAIIGAADALGALRLVGIVLIGTFLVAPRTSWRLVSNIASAPANLYRSYPLHRLLWLRLVGLGHRYQRYPLHRMLTSWLQRPAKPAVEPAERLEYEAPMVAEPEVKVASRAPELMVETFAPVAEELIEKVEKAGGKWQLPSISILDRTPEIKPAEVDTERGTRLIEEALASYGVEAKVVQVNVGPTVTQYGVEPGWDRKFKEIKEKDKDGSIRVRLEEVSKTRVKVERIASLANDLALALAAPTIKIEAPVPGKSMVGIEVPNSITGLVSLRSVMESTAFQKLKNKSKLPLALGEGVSGEIVVADLAKMPHLLIAGATGSGKSICIKSTIANFLVHATPDEVRLLLIDPKRVELVAFNNVPHLISPVLVDREKAVAALKWVNREMDHRYDKLASVGARDIEAYNKNPRVGEPFPYFLLIIDELADLMAAAPDEVERTLCRLAQLARATGIHLIVATQRPSVDVVTGLIKANFPARVSFAVTSQVDSRTILDTGGAEKLLGRGDLLFLPPDAARPKRLQGSFVSEAEIERLVSFWLSQRPEGVYVPQLVEELAQESLGVSPEDLLLEKAKRLALEHSRISTSFLQRRLGIGYPRAARLMDLLEEQGVVATGEPGKSREVLGGRRGKEVE
jgi:S-DNA-T family DNA segregation ATPase FtsK/SpoIIIE